MNKFVIILGLLFSSTSFAVCKQNFHYGDSFEIKTGFYKGCSLVLTGIQDRSKNSCYYSVDRVCRDKTNDTSDVASFNFEEKELVTILNKKD